MECFVSHSEDYCLKMEDNSDQYLFGDLLNQPEERKEQFFDQILNEHQQPMWQLTRQQEPLPSVTLETKVIEEVSPYLCLRTASLSQILDYVEEYCPVPHSNHMSLVRAIRKEKMKLKRQHAKRRSFQTENLFRVVMEDSDLAQQPLIKIEDQAESPLMQIYSDEESQETKKKKRNRMSAQNSRDRKKQYIKGIEEENQQLKRQLEDLTNGPSVASKTFLKQLLCLGISSLVEERSSCENCIRTPSHDDLTEEEKTPIHQSVAVGKPALDLHNCQEMLSLGQQAMLGQVLEFIEGHSQNPVEEVESLVRSRAPKTKRIKKTSGN